MPPPYIWMYELNDIVPITGPKRIPSLVDENGEFKDKSLYREAIVSARGRISECNRRRRLLARRG